MKKLLTVILNKYIITLAAFAVWMLYFDQYDYFSMRQRKKQLQDTQDNIAYLQKQISNMEQQRSAMISEPKELEKYAREHYYMKRDNEDLFVMERK